MPRLHIGLKKSCPVSAIELGGHSFQKESWEFDEDGNHSTRPGLVFKIADEKDIEAFEEAVKKDEARYVIRVSVTKSGGIRADVHDVTIPGHRREKGKDLPVSKFTYVKRLDDELEEPTLAEILDENERPILEAVAEGIKKNRRSRQTEVGAGEKE